MSKKLVIAGVVATVGLTGLGAAAAHATTTNSTNNSGTTSQNARPQLTEEQKAAKRAEREQKIKDEIAQLVKDGKLTQDQADKLLAKRAELQKEREANKANKPTTKPSELTDEQKSKMKAAREAKQTELKNWLKEQGIDESYAKYLSGRGGKGGEKRQGAKPDTSTKQATNNS